MMTVTYYMSYYNNNNNNNNTNKNKNKNNKYTFAKNIALWQTKSLRFSARGSETFNYSPRDYTPHLSTQIMCVCYQENNLSSVKFLLPSKLPWNYIIIIITTILCNIIMDLQTILWRSYYYERKKGRQNGAPVMQYSYTWAYTRKH